MDVLEAIERRRAIKHFDPEHEMSDEEVQKIIGLGMLAPTAFNVQHWRFVTVQDKDLLLQIREAAWNQAQVTDSSLLVILCADIKAWEKNPERYWRNGTKEAQDILLPAIKGYYEDSEQVQRDEAHRSCGIAAQTLMLAAKGMGYDSCPMDGFDFGKVGELINLPQDHVITMFVAIGKSTKDAWPRPGQLSVEEVRIQNKFS